MADRRRPENWWRSRSLNWRLFLLGAILGTSGAVGLSATYNIGRFSIAYVPWILINLFLFEIPTMVILGLVVSAPVLAVLLRLPKVMPPTARALVAGIVAMLVSAALIYAYYTLFPLTYDRWVAAAFTGPVVGSAFAVVVCRWAKAGSQDMALRSRPHRMP